MMAAFLAMSAWVSTSKISCNCADVAGCRIGLDSKDRDRDNLNGLLWNNFVFAEEKACDFFGELLRLRSSVHFTLTKSHAPAAPRILTRSFQFPIFLVDEIPFLFRSESPYLRRVVVLVLNRIAQSPSVISPFLSNSARLVDLIRRERSIFNYFFALLALLAIPVNCHFANAMLQGKIGYAHAARSGLVQFCNLLGCECLPRDRDRHGFYFLCSAGRCQWQCGSQLRC